MSGSELQSYFDSDGEKLKTLSVIDIACAQHAREILVGKEQIKQRETALNRIEGKPKQTIDITRPPMPSLPENATPEQLAEAMAALRTQG